MRWSQRSFAWRQSPSLKGKCPGTPFGGFPDTPVPAHDAAKRYSLPSGLVQTSFLTRVRHEQLFAIGKVPLRCARNSRVLRQWLKFTYPRTSCKFTKPQSNTNTYYPDNYRYPSVVVLLVSGVSARGRHKCKQSASEVLQSI